MPCIIALIKVHIEGDEGMSKHLNTLALGALITYFITTKIWTEAVWPITFLAAAGGCMVMRFWQETKGLSHYRFFAAIGALIVASLFASFCIIIGGGIVGQSIAQVFLKAVFELMYTFIVIAFWILVLNRFIARLILKQT